MPKMEAHEKAVLHRAFSVFIMNKNGETMLQQRAAHKYHSPLLWTNTCCSHQRVGETNIEAGKRRLQEEMGFTVQSMQPTNETRLATVKKKKPSRRNKCDKCQNFIIIPLNRPNSNTGTGDTQKEFTHCNSRNCHVMCHTFCLTGKDGETTADWQCKYCTKDNIPTHSKIYEVQWEPSWQSEQAVHTMPSGKRLIAQYKQGV